MAGTNMIRGSNGIQIDGMKICYKKHQKGELLKSRKKQIV